VDEGIAHEAADMLKERPPHGCQQGVLRKHIRNMQDQVSHCSTSRSIWPRCSTCVEAGPRGNTSKFLRTPDANSIPMSDSTAYGNLNAKDTQTICEAIKN
jgi:hypothetical protein